MLLKKQNILRATFCFVALSISQVQCLYGQSEKEAVRQFIVPVGSGQEKIGYFKGDFKDLEVGGFDIDGFGNIFISDWLEGSIKKFSPDGTYLGKLKVDEVRLYNVICFEDSVFFFDAVARKNDLYVFSSQTLQCVRIDRKIFSWYLTHRGPVSFDSKMVFQLFKPGERRNSYQIINLLSKKLFLDQSSPFDTYTDLDTTARRFMGTHNIGDEPTPYLGRIHNWFVFEGGTFGKPEYRIAFFQVGDSKPPNKLELKLGRQEIGNTVGGALESHWHLKKGRYIYFLGLNDDNNILISKIDLKKIFPQIYGGRDICALIEKVVSNQALRSDELGSLTKEEYRILRNSVFAKHGRPFKSADLREYFYGNQMNPCSIEFQIDSMYSDKLLTDYDLENLRRITELEKGIEK